MTDDEPHELTGSTLYICQLAAAEERIAKLEVALRALIRSLPHYDSRWTGECALAIRNAVALLNPPQPASVSWPRDADGSEVP